MQPLKVKIKTIKNIKSLNGVINIYLQTKIS